SPSGTDVNYFLAHHVTVSVAKTAAGSAGAADQPASEMAMSTLAQHQMGQNPILYPDDVGVALPNGSAVSFSVHLHSVGRDLPFNGEVAFNFQPKGYTPKFVRTHYSVFPSSQIEELDLPAGQENIRYDFYSVLKQPAKLMSFEPHMHSNGRRMCLEA